VTIQRPTFRIELADGTEHTVEVLHGDQLRAELQAPHEGIPTDPSQLPLATTTLWLWAACKRLGLTQAKFRVFADSELVALGKAPQAAVDPTRQDQPTVRP
jgi:hypothetical protein